MWPVGRHIANTLPNCLYALMDASFAVQLASKLRSHFFWLNILTDVLEALKRRSLKGQLAASIFPLLHMQEVCVNNLAKNTRRTAGRGFR